MKSNNEIKQRNQAMQYLVKKNELCVRKRLPAAVLTTIFLSASVLSLSAAPAMAQSESVDVSKSQMDIAQTLRQRYPDNSIQSSEAADQALAEVKEIRARIEANFEADKRICYPKFFTNLCLNKAKDKQREDLASIRPIEIEANAYNRKQRVVERDRNLAEKAAADAQDRKDRLIPTPLAKDAELEAKKTLTDSGDKKATRKVRADDATKKRAVDPEAQDQHQENAAAEAAMRAENVKKYDAKVREYETRQREMAKKQAGKALPEHDKAP